MKKWQLLPLFFGGLLLFFLAFYMGLTPKQSLIEAEALDSAPDYFLTDVDIKIFNQDGTAIETLSAKELKHYNESNESYLTQPNMSKSQQGNNWIAKSNFGLINDSSKDIYLNGDSEIIHTNYSGGTIHLNADIILYKETTQEIFATGNSYLLTEAGETQANDIGVNINDETISLSGEVNGQYKTAK
ncbi:LPS export ABC transporter periplasmic protein LptC [Marinomonas sp. 15G1-11]|uniref:LPS export ABC transporter periplasmic protein LptC n=1 Tax=Marinomonas phaeophyticola TaxID=3004091 RepID=A0ABT4JXA2_9GAMM|nr:LPS export ABC transporter periplasmic protein LptC [Marinomonas sp. 15G1-11]MCZ2723036.1 LPS export ABC transporter periplasmic protein LptC [Marinomonas sp. 15G1-11]